jgi:ComF family protein
MPVSQLVAPIVDFIFPPRCPLCGAALAQHGGLCAGCWTSLVMPSEPACPRCSRPFVRAPAVGTVCALCLASPPRHDGIVAATLYNDVSRRLVLAFKRGGRIALAPFLARMITARMAASPAGAIGPDWLAVPVPLHRWRLWSRGYNQSALLARELAAQSGATLLVDGLIRTRATPTLGGLGRRARARILQGAIQTRPSARQRLSGAQVVLVDDVLTSGATTSACVRALKRAGAKTVVIACFARVLDEALPTDEAALGPWART